MTDLETLVLIVVETCFHFLLAYCLILFGSVAFDSVHWGLHKLYKSRFPLFRWVGDLHMVHHRFFDEQVRIREEFRKENFIKHSIPEYLTQLFVTMGFFLIVDALAVSIAMMIETILFYQDAIQQRGEDGNHKSLLKVDPPPRGIKVDSTYHAYHHIYPDNYYSSMIKIFDYVMGCATQIDSRAVYVVGSGIFCDVLQDYFDKIRVNVTRAPTSTDIKLKNTNIIILCGDTKDKIDVFHKILTRSEKDPHSPMLPIELWDIYEPEKVEEFLFAELGKFRGNKSVHYRVITVPRIGIRSAKLICRILFFLIRRGMTKIPLGSSLESFRLLNRLHSSVY